jgi:hypothetical protein
MRFTYCLTDFSTINLLLLFINPGFDHCLFIGSSLLLNRNTEGL